VTFLQTNFTAGELSPRLVGRSDIERYANGADQLENVLPMIHGGVRRRPGLVYVAGTKDNAKRSRVIPFVFSTSEAYVLELGDQYLRFYKNNARLGAPYEIAAPWTEAQLADVDYVQGADTMFLMHPAYPTRRLRRFGDTNWSLDAIPFDIEPHDEIGHSFSVSLTLSASTVGTGRTVTAASGIFLNGDVGRSINYQGGVLRITGFTSATQVTGDISVAFPGTAIPADVWTLADSPQDTCTPSAKDPLEATCTLTTTLNCWRSSDVGKLVRINGGLVKVDTYTSATQVSGKIKQVLSATVGAPANSWTLEASLWSSANGYPSAGTLYQQRLILGGSAAFPQTVWGSSVGTYLDFMLGSSDSDAFGYTLASDEINPIRHFASGKQLFALTYGAEFTIKGGVEKPITPTNVQVENQSSYGSSSVRPVRAGKDMLFVQRAGLKVRSIRYDASDEDFDAEDMTVLSEHITGPGVVDMAWQQEPDAVLWCVRSDGVLATLTLSKKQDVAAWARQVTDGAVESVAKIPVAGGEQVWCVVRRTVGGATVRYVERFDATVTLDSAVVASLVAPGQATWGGLTHLEGRSVDAVADGVYMGRFTVQAGTIVLPRNALSVQIGLPFAHRVKLLTPELQTGLGSAQGNSMRTSEISLRLLDTYAAKVNGQELPFRQLGGNLLDAAPPSFTGIERVELLGWERGRSDIEITSEIPLPFHLLAVVRKLTVND
jgi:hypothetical protein